MPGDSFKLMCVFMPMYDWASLAPPPASFFLSPPFLFLSSFSLPLFLSPPPLSFSPSEDGVRMEESGLTSDQLVPDCVDETMKGSDRQPKTSFPSDDCGFSPLFYVRLSY